MDPNQTYLDMFEAMKSGDLETARERALALKAWFAKGGFYPHQLTPQAMHAYIVSVLRRTTGHGEAIPFSLTCFYCDAGMDIESEEAAIEQGWIEIEPALALAEANYRGVCPDCRTEHE